MIPYGFGEQPLRNPLLPRLLVFMSLLIPCLMWAAGEQAKDVVKYGAVVGLSCVAGFAYLYGQSKAVFHKLIWTSAIPVVAVYVLMIFLSSVPKGPGLQVLGSLVLMLGWLTYLTSVKWRPEQIRWLAMAAPALLLIQLIAYPFLPKVDHYQGLTLQKNFLGAMCFMTYALLRFARTVNEPSSRPSRLFYLLPLVLVLLANSRGALIAALVGEAVFLIWPWLTRNRVRFILALPAGIAALLWASWFYTVLGDYTWFQELQDTVYNLTGANIYSGRNLVWPILFETIAQRPYLGYGSGARPNIFLVEKALDVTWSAHSLYFTIIIQIGYVGLGAFLMLLTGLWSKAYTLRHDPLTRIAGSFFIGVCVYQSFECQLTQNNLDVGIALWLIPAMMLTGLSKRLDQEPTPKG